MNKIIDKTETMTKQEIIDIINADLQKLNKEKLQSLIYLLQDG